MDQSAGGAFCGRSGHHCAAECHWIILGKRCIQLRDEKVRLEGAQVLLEKVRLEGAQVLLDEVELTFKEGF